MMTSSLLSSHLLPVLLLLLLSPTRASNDFPRACQSPHDTYPFCDTSKSYESRVSDLVGRLTLGEKVLQMDNTAPSVPRLGIPAYQWWSEALHGVNSRCDPVSGRCPTSFPAGMNLGASFDPKLWTSVGQAIGDEARALRSAGVRNFLNATFGLDVWMPNLNVFRDPRWGRGQETPGEDPYLTGQYAKYMISAVQGNLTASPYVKLVATAKHFDAYSLELWHGMDRHHFDAVVSAQDLNQTYYPAFRDAVVEGGVLGVMCSYNSVNGVPACANNFLQKELRDSWGFDGYVTSDCGAIQDIYATHNYTKTPQEASAVSVKAGTDVDCGDVYGASLQAAVQQGLITEAEIDVSLSRLFMIRMRTGMFDPLDVQPYVNYTIDVVNSQKHRDLARSAACKGIVLLKNEPVVGASEPLLPLDDSQPLKVALIGPNANATTTLCSNYFGGLPYIVSPFAAINARSSVTVQYEKGCDVVGTDKSGFAAAVDAASKAEVAIVILGLDQQVESEGHDRDAIDLPGVQEDLLQAVMAAQPNTVLVLINGGPVAIEWAAAKVPAIVEAFYPGEEGGTCIAEVLFGEYSPSARLPVTIYPAGYVDEVSMLSMDMRKSPGRTYRFYTGTPIYEFGHGLSYSQWKYSVVPADGATLVPTVSGAANVTFNVSVTNLGPHTASMTVLLFITTPSSAAQECPLKQLFFFTEVTMAAPDTHVFQVQASGADAGCYDSSGGHVVPAGEYVVSVEDSRASFVVA